MKQNIHIIFLKYPIEGRVKTRLAKTIGEEKALKIYKYLAEKVVLGCKSDNYDTALFIDGNIEGFKAWLGDDKRYVFQSEGELGERLDKAFVWAYDGGYKRCAVTGSDIANLTAAEVSTALGALDTSDSALGKSTDGGYYLIAFRNDSYLSDVFYDIEWSTDRVLRETTEKLDNRNLSYTIIKELADIDTEDDLKFLNGDHLV